jgi:hypothetical protein
MNKQIPYQEDGASPKQLPQYEIEDMFSELPPAPKKPQAPHPQLDNPNVAYYPSSAIIPSDQFTGTPVKRNRWDDRFWRQFEKSTNSNPVTRWAFNAKNLSPRDQSDSGLENVAELVPNPYTAIGLGYDDIMNSEGAKSGFEAAALAAPLARKAFPLASIATQGLDYADDTRSDNISHAKEGRHDTFWPWGMYDADVARRKEKRGF